MLPVDSLSLIISTLALVAAVVIGLLIHYKSTKLVSQIRMRSDDAFNTAKHTFEDVQKVRKELKNSIENAVDAIEELQQNTNKTADRLDGLDTKVQTDIQGAFDSIKEELQQKNIEITEQFSKLNVKIDDIENFIKNLADFAGLKAVPAPVDIFGPEVGAQLIEGGFATLESIANAEIMDIAPILPDFSFNKVKELIEQAKKVALKSDEENSSLFVKT